MVVLFFSKVDLIWAYQIPMKPYDIPKSVTTPFGSFEFLFMSFGLWNAMSTYQRFIGEVVSGLDFVFTYLDDLLIASDITENPLQHLSKLFSVFAPTMCTSTPINVFSDRPVQNFLSIILTLMVSDFSPPKSMHFNTSISTRDSYLKEQTSYFL